MLRRTIIAGMLSVSAVLVPRPVLADAAGEAMVADIINSISAAPQWNATSSAIRSDGDRVIVESLSVNHATNGMTISVQALELTGLTDSENGYFARSAATRGMVVRYDLISMIAAGAVRHSDVSIANTVSVETMDLTDVFLPRLGSANTAVEDEGMLAPLIAVYSYFAGVELASAVAPVIVNVQTVSEGAAGSGQTSRITYRDSRLTNWRDGVMERMEIGRIDLTMSGGPSGEVVISAQSALAEHLDLAHYMHVLDPEKYRDGGGDGAWKTALRRLEYSGVRVNAGAAETRIERISAADFELRQSEKPFLNGLEELFAILASGREPDEAETLALVGDFLPHMLGAFRVGQIRVEGTMVRPVVSSDPGSFSMDELIINGFSSAGIDRFSMDGIAATGPDNFSIKLETVGFSGLTMPDWDVLQAFIKAGAGGEDVGRNPDLMAQILDLYPSIDTFSMRALSGNAPGKETMHVDEAVLETRKRVAGFMAAGRGAVRGLSIPASYLENIGNPNPLRMLGYDRFAMDYVFESDWNESTTVLNADIGLSIENAAELKLHYGLSGVTDAEVRRIIRRVIEMEASGQGGDPGQIMDLLNNLGTTGVSVSLTDRSIVQRALRVAAEKQGSDAATYGRQLKAAIPFFLSAVPRGQFRDQLNEAVQAALDGGQETTISLAPGRSIAFSEIILAATQNPWSLIDLLGARVSTEPVN